MITNTELQQFKGKPHFGIKCSCGEACVSEITEEQARLVEVDPVVGLGMLSPKDLEGVLDFWGKHSTLGHKPEPTLCEIGPLGKFMNFPAPSA